MSKKKPGIRIVEGDIETAISLSQSIPDFIDPPEREGYEQRFKGVPNLILIAYIGNEPVGFKAGYERDGYFYSWLGGVLPVHQRKGIARALADRQEKWAKEHNYNTITFKTRNQHKAMLVFALQNGFDIIGFEEKEEVATNRIWLRKTL